MIQCLLVNCLYEIKIMMIFLFYFLGVHITAQTAANLSTLFDVGGIVGGIIAGIATDLTGKPASTCAIMLILAIPSVSGLFHVRLCHQYSLLRRKNLRTLIKGI